MTDKQIIERLKTDLDFERSKRKTLQSELTAKEQELQEAMDNYVKLDNQRVKEYNELVDLYKAKEQECEELKEELHKNFEEKDILHLIIDRLLEASGYDTNTASAEEFEDVYEKMRYEKRQLYQLKAENEDLKIYIESNEQQVKEVETLVMDNDRLINELDQLKAENKHLNDLLNQALKDYEKARQTLTEIKEIVGIGLVDGLQPEEYSGFLKILQAQILQKISECGVMDE